MALACARALATAAWLIGCSPVALAIGGAQSLDQLSHTLLTAREGAPSRIDGMAQSVDGFLWLATASGLFRYDGRAFTRYEPPAGESMPDADIFTVKAAADGSVWAGTRFGYIYRIVGGHLHAFGSADGLDRHSVVGLSFDDDGTPWAAVAGQGLLRFDGRRWVGVPGPDGRTVSPWVPNGLLRDREGRLWLATLNEIYCLEPHARSLVRRYVAHSFVSGMFLDADAEVWVADDSRVFPALRPDAGRDLSDVATALHLPRDTLVGIAFMDREGHAWGAVNQRRFRIAAAWLQRRRGTPTDAAPEFLPSDRRERGGTEWTSALEDREGDLWIAGDSALERLHSNKFTRVDAQAGTLGSSAMAMQADGTLWIGGHQVPHLGSIVGDGGFEVHAADGDMSARTYASMFASQDGSLYVGGIGVLHRLVGRKIEAVELPTVSPEAVVQAITEDADGDLWISLASGGVFRRRAGRWSGNEAIGLKHSAAISLQSGEGKQIWIGYPGGAAAVVEGDRVRRLGVAEGLDVGNVLAFLPQAGGTWIAGVNGVVFFDGVRAHPVKDARGQLLRGVSGIVRGADGDLWFNGESGVLRVTAAEAARFVQDPAHLALGTEVLGLDAGIEGTPATLRPLPTAVGSPDGRLWFATSGGLYWLDPRHIARNPVAPVVEIVDVDHGGASDPGAPSVTLPMRTRALRFDYTASSLRMPEEVRFRYRLEGVDADWQDAGARRQAFYTNLAPGRYEFHVMAANEDGVWSPRDATLAIFIPPAFWQTRWFALLCALVAASFVFGLHLLRLRMLSRRAAIRFGDILQERERIARDLHDTLLQDTQGFVLQFQLAARTLAPDDARRERMEALLDDVDRTILHARDRVRGLRDEEGERVDLAGELGGLGAELSASCGVRFELRLDPALPAVRGTVRRDVFLIGREALLNAFRHARASTVTLTLGLQGGDLRLCVNDDGSGIDAALQDPRGRPGHFGLVSMRERSESAGGKLTLRSHVGEGTEVSVVVPARLAFDMAPRWRRWWRIGIE